MSEKESVIEICYRVARDGLGCQEWFITSDSESLCCSAFRELARENGQVMTHFIIDGAKYCPFCGKQLIFKEAPTTSASSLSTADSRY